MEKKWTYCAVYSIIQIHFVRGVWEEMFNAEEDVYALPGSDVNLTCQIRKKGFLVQMQWSKFTDKLDLIALYHPEYGSYCAIGSPCKSLVTYREIPGNVSQWTLHLRNMSSSLTGKYECSFTLYPEGIWTKIYNLLIQTNVIQDEWRSNHTIEIEINRTLEIPCFQNISSEIASEFTFAWLVEHNGTQETLITQDRPISNSTLFKDRVRLGTDHGLRLSPVQIHDDRRKFSCHVMVRPGKIFMSTITVKVFAKPETPVIVENNSMDVLGKRIFNCSLRNVFPTANLTWFTDRSFPQGEREGRYITNEERKGKGGFLELKSVLTMVYGNKPAQSNNLTIWCTALSPAPGNKVWNISSKKITFSLGLADPPTDPPTSGTESALGTQPSPASSTSPTTASWMPSEMYSSSPSGADSTLHGDVFPSTTRTFSEVPKAASGSTKNSDIRITGIVVNKPKDGMSWPVIVAALVFSCVVVFGLGVRKWCQYQKEIMERPPPFKPPPPPIKYTCIQESIGCDLPCQEMETL
uniref:CD96 molecule n=1 Tax=Equus caballus TaxID=9796 RepID=A0A3Q2HTA1_HORSE